MSNLEELSKKTIEEIDSLCVNIENATIEDCEKLKEAVYELKALREINKEYLSYKKDNMFWEDFYKTMRNKKYLKQFEFDLLPLEAKIQTLMKMDSETLENFCKLPENKYLCVDRPVSDRIFKERTLQEFDKDLLYDAIEAYEYEPEETKLGWKNFYDRLKQLQRFVSINGSRPELTIVETMISPYFYRNIRDQYNEQQLLERAIEIKNYKLIDYLLSKGVTHQRISDLFFQREMFDYLDRYNLNPKPYSYYNLRSDKQAFWLLNNDILPRPDQISQVLRFSNLELNELLISKGIDLNLAFMPIEIFQKDDIDTIKWLIDHNYKIRQSDIEKATSFYAIKILKYLYSLYPQLFIYSKYANAAAEQGFIDLLHWYETIGVLPDENLDLNLVFQNGNIDILKFLVSHGININTHTNSFHGIVDLISDNNFPALKYLHEIKFPFDQRILNYAIIYKKFEIAEWLYSLGYKIYPLNIALKLEDDLEILEWLEKHGVQFDKKFFISLAINGNIKSIKWLYDRGISEFIPDEYFYNIWRQHPETYKWLLSKNLIHDDDIY